MTEKRFELTYFDCDYITDHLTGEDYPTIDKYSMFELVKQINELVDENEELKQAYTQLKQLEKENEELISIKRFADRHGINIFNIDEAFRECWNDNGELVKENQKLKTQLLHGDGVCDICKHEYLVKTGEYYVSECKKGHEECSKIDLAYCEDFEVKECKE